MTKVYEGFIIQDTTPLAFGLVESWREAMLPLAAPEGADPQKLAEAMINHQNEVIKALGKIEQAVNLNAGKVITGG